MPISLTPVQADCVRVFAELRDAMGCAPTVVEVARELDLVPSNVERLYDELEERGWIERLPGRARGVRLLHAPPPAPDDFAVELTTRGEAIARYKCPV